ncbi:MAG TPA: P1 family peptidase [Solirubrobacteraceae bacterium]|nr:P1 family peptidase [Solirubrobacteraceae bacterium]
MRAREAGIVVGAGAPGPHNAITDIAGVRVGHATLIEGDGPLRVGEGPVRTGVTVIVPADGIWDRPLFCGCHTLNGNGELTGLEWVRESGMLTSPIALTNTHSVGVVRDALIAHEVAQRAASAGHFWGLPVVGETWDGMLNDTNGLHVRPEHVQQALAAARTGPVPEGGVGGGTGMICHGFKGGIGTASRVVDPADGGFTVGVLVQANHGRRERLSICGVPVGRMLGPDQVPLPEDPAERAGMGVPPQGSGSIIAIVATDAPLLPQQCRRLAQRAGLGIARTGGVGEHTSGDIFLCFATGNRGMVPGELGAQGPLTVPLSMLSDAHITALFDAVVEATEEAIVNALSAARTMVGRDGVTAHAMPLERVAALLHGS